jgi:hypothetical protein
MMVETTGNPCPHPMVVTYLGPIGAVSITSETSQSGWEGP